MKLSVVVPAHNEEGSVAATVSGIVVALEEARIQHEVIVIDDGSSDGTAAAVRAIEVLNPNVHCLPSHYPRGFGFAVRSGLDLFTGDDPADLVRYYNLLDEGYDCAFGSRFIRGSHVEGYPRFKLVINRVVNWGIRALFRTGFNDTTNAFKAYRREVIETVAPLLSNHFNLTVEIPLKASVRGHSFGVIPISWRDRSTGRSKLSLKEMGSRYLFIVLYVFLEAHLSCGDYRRPEASTASRRRNATLRLLPRRVTAEGPTEREAAR